MVIFTARNIIQIYTKFANFTGLYLVLHFTTFSNQSLQFYSFYDAFSSCGVGFRSSCLDQNLVYSWNPGTAEQGGAGGHGPPLFRWIIKNYRIKSSLPAWNSFHAILPPPPPPPPPLLNRLRDPWNHPLSITWSWMQRNCHTAFSNRIKPMLTSEVLRIEPFEPFVKPYFELFV